MFCRQKRGAGYHDFGKANPMRSNLQRIHVNHPFDGA